MQVAGASEEGLPMTCKETQYCSCGVWTVRKIMTQKKHRGRTIYIHIWVFNHRHKHKESK
jgi:hypothetical protein